MDANPTRSVKLLPYTMELAPIGLWVRVYVPKRLPRLA